MMARVWQCDHANHANHASHAKTTSDIADYILSFYNSVRLHSKLGNLPQCLRASIGNYATDRGVRKNFTRSIARPPRQDGL